VDDAVMRIPLDRNVLSLRITKTGFVEIRIVEVDVHEVPLARSFLGLWTALAEGIGPGCLACDVVIVSTAEQNQATGAE